MKGGTRDGDTVVPAPCSCCELGPWPDFVWVDEAGELEPDGD